MKPITPKTQVPQKASIISKSKTLKIHLTPEQAAQVKSMAHQHELSQSEFGRFRLLGQTSYTLPDASKLEAICRQLAGIGANINQAQKVINESKADGTLNSSQFKAMYRVIVEARRIWLEPLNELRAELTKFKSQP